MESQGVRVDLAEGSLCGRINGGIASSCFRDLVELCELVEDGLHTGNWFNESTSDQHLLWDIVD